MSIRLPVNTGDVVPLDGPIVMQHANRVPDIVWPTRPKTGSVTMHIQVPGLLGDASDQINFGRFLRLGWS